MARCRSFVPVLALTLALAAQSRATGHPQVRPAGGAGRYYSADPAQLRAAVDAALAKAAVAAPPPLAILVPHASHAYSGEVAARAFARLRGRGTKRVVVIAPAHFEDFSYASVYDGDAYATPLGRVRVDRRFARRLARADRSIRLGRAGHASVTTATAPEHAIEVELPFLQRALGDFELVPIVMGDASYAASVRLGSALAAVIGDASDTLLVASSDLSHFHDAAAAAAMDRELLEAVAQGDAAAVSRNVLARKWEACGVGPIVAMMVAAQRLGAERPRLLRYATSGDVTGDQRQVVGYAAAVITRPPPATAAGLTLTSDERSQLLEIARQSAGLAVREHAIFQPALPASPRLAQAGAAFVTLTVRGELRGCVGDFPASQPLYLAVRDAAAQAALHDPRFPPVRPGELSGLEFEIAALSPFRHIAGPTGVRLGTEGILLRRGAAQAVLLPQVATEQGWDRSTFVSQAAIKAGLASDGWKSQDADLFAFTTLRFSDQQAKAALGEGRGRARH